MAKTEGDGKIEPWLWDHYGWEMNFVTQMQALREAKGWSQTEFAKRLAENGLKFHQPTVQRIESGIRPLKLTEALTIAEVLETRLEVMLRAASVPMVYDELAEYVAPGAFEFHVRHAEALLDRVSLMEDHIRELVGSYHAAVDQSGDVELNEDLLAVAAELERTNNLIRPIAASAVSAIEEAVRAFDQLPRNYPPRLREKPDVEE
ncbi:MULTISPECIES: helix-turn-helix transcriptional regulator [Rhodococcus]|uniref:helix-turn-helix domain-containing protein n=1 Tax=Rhodococcus TaxID=1827 RepID=UPI0015E0B56A|nr:MULTISPECIES: helix-turn-helix transcriptional regulator [Rhodococcus]WKX00244.1 helix-turn-helix transcriptional regulator [Rhodococcus aetherivorans]